MKFIFSIIFFLTNLNLLAQTNQSAGTIHTHGAASLKVVSDQSQLRLQLTAPSGDIVGFERKAKNDAEKIRVKAALSKMKNVSSLFKFPPEALCSLKNAQAKEITLESHSDEHEGHKHLEEHRDYVGTYDFECQKIKKLSVIDIQVFQQFKKVKTIQAEVYINGKSLKQKLSPAQNSLGLTELF